MVKGQHTGNKSKDTSTDEMELEQGKQKKVCDHPTPEKMKEKGPNLTKKQGSKHEGTTTDDNASMTEESFDEMEEEESNIVAKLDERFAMPSVSDPAFWKSEIKGPTNKWNKWKDELGKYKPYDSTNIIGEEEDSAGKLIHAGRQLILKDGTGSVEPHQWLRLLEDCLEKGNIPLCQRKKLMMLMGRLSQTDPMKAFQFNEEGGLHSGDISNAWAATYAIFGATWKDRTRWNEQ